jgi:mono/diheme cytochrome c family protein
MSKFFVYFLCLVSVIGVGYFGGSMVFPENSLASPDQLQDGEKLYAANCAGCHPKGGNVINPALPIVGSPKLNDLNTFTKFNRNPLRPDGSKGVMPAYPKEKISDQEINLIYQYATKGLAGKQSP